MHGSRPDVGLLELQRLLCKERAAGREGLAVYDVFDPTTQEQVGVVREQSGSLGRLLRRFLSPRLVTTTLEVRETEDESLVFMVHRAMGWWRRRIDIYDADDRWMGCGEKRAFWGQGGFWIYDRRNLPFAQIRGAFQSRGYRFLGPDGRELGTVTRERTEPRTEASAPVQHCLVSISDELAGQPLAKMLLLGVALVIHMVHHGKGN